MKKANYYLESIIRDSEGIKPKSKESNLKSSGSGKPNDRNAATKNQTPPSNRDAATGINPEAHMGDT